MIDAYTIGITLALEDGVSEGVLAIRRDLAALDTAIAESAGQLVMLRKLAADMALPMPRLQAVQGASVYARLDPGKQEMQPVAIPADPPLASHAAAPPDPPATVPAVAPPVPAPEKGSPSLRPAAQPAAIPTAVVARSVAAPVPSQLTLPAPALPSLQTASPMAPVTPASIVPPALAASIAAPAPAAPRPPGGDQRAQPPEARAERAPSLDYASIARAIAPSVSAPVDLGHQQLEQPAAMQATSGIPLQVTAATLPGEKSSRPIPQPPQVGRSPVPTPLSAPKLPDAPTPEPSQRKPAAPVVSLRMPPRAPHAVTGEPNRATLVPEETGSLEADRPAYAELHLDGAALGRWVMRHLERQVVRPQAGATGFDPRMTPTWAGAPIGN